MISRRSVIAFALPVFALMFLAAGKAWVQKEGTPLTLPITGFDPRDLLSGHYLTYRVDFGAVDPCDPMMEGSDMFLCAEPRFLRYGKPGSMECDLFVRGKCQEGRFQAGIEKFFIPEEHARILDQAVRDKRGSIILSIPPSGNPVIRDLLIDGKSWRELVKQGK